MKWAKSSSKRSYYDIQFTASGQGIAFRMKLLKTSYTYFCKFIVKVDRIEIYVWCQAPLVVDSAIVSDVTITIDYFI